MKRLDDIPGTIDTDSAEIRAIAAGADDLSPQGLPLADLWKLLVTGALRVVDTFHTDQRCYLTLASPATLGRAPRRLSARKVVTLQRILLGERQKAVALDCNLAASTIALTVAECLRTLGLDSRTARVPSLVVLAAHASRGVTDVHDCRVSDFILPPTEAVQSPRPYRVVSIARPDLDLGPALSAAEYAVARLLVEGKSYAEMALLRGTSVRTVANQVASVFQKVGVSGRSEFLSSLVRSPRFAAMTAETISALANNSEPAPTRSGRIPRSLRSVRLAESTAPMWDTSPRLEQGTSGPSSAPLTSRSNRVLAAQ